MLSEGFTADPLVYHYLIRGQAKNSNADGVFALYEELKEKLGGSVSDGVVYGDLMRGNFSRGMEEEAEELYRGMSEKGVSPDEFTFNLLMGSCFKENRPDDAAGYFRTMVDSKLRPNLAVYNKLVEGLVKVGKVDEAKSFYDLMVGKLKMDDANYEFMMKAFFEVGKADEVLKDY